MLLGIVFLSTKRLNVYQIHSDMYPVYGYKCFTKATASTRLM